MQYLDPFSQYDPFEAYESTPSESGFQVVDPQEPNDGKKLNRKISNRESARRSRKKHKDHVAKLEAKVASLQSQIMASKLELTSLQTTNEHLKDEVAWHESLIQAHSPALLPTDDPNEIQLEIGAPAPSFHHYSEEWKSNSTGKMQFSSNAPHMSIKTRYQNYDVMQIIRHNASLTSLKAKATAI